MCVWAYTSYVVCEDAPQVRCQKKIVFSEIAFKAMLGPSVTGHISSVLPVSYS